MVGCALSTNILLYKIEVANRAGMILLGRAGIAQ